MANISHDPHEWCWVVIWSLRGILGKAMAPREHRPGDVCRCGRPRRNLGAARDCGGEVPSPSAGAAAMAPHGSRSVLKSPAGWCPMIEGFEHCWNVPWLLFFFVAFVMGMATPFFAVFAKPTAGFRSISQVEAMHRIDENVDEVGCALRSCQCWGEAEHSEGDQGMEQWRMLHGVRWLRDGFRVWI